MQQSCKRGCVIIQRKYILFTLKKPKFLIL
jgi:hypothetical protein